MENIQKKSIIYILIAVVALLIIGFWTNSYIRNKAIDSTLTNETIGTTTRPYITDNFSISKSITYVVGFSQQKYGNSDVIVEDCGYESGYRLENGESTTTSIFAFDPSLSLPGEYIIKIGPVSKITTCPGDFQVYELLPFSRFYPMELVIKPGASSDMRNTLSDFSFTNQDKKTVNVITTKLNNIYSGIVPLGKEKGWTELYRKMTTDLKTDQSGGMPSTILFRGRYLNDTTFQVEDIFFTVG